MSAADANADARVSVSKLVAILEQSRSTSNENSFKKNGSSNNTVAATSPSRGGQRQGKDRGKSPSSSTVGEREGEKKKSRTSASSNRHGGEDDGHNNRGSHDGNSKFIGKDDRGGDGREDFSSDRSSGSKRSPDPAGSIRHSNGSVAGNGVESQPPPPPPPPQPQPLPPPPSAPPSTTFADDEEEASSSALFDSPSTSYIPQDHLRMTPPPRSSTVRTFAAPAASAASSSSSSSSSSGSIRKPVQYTYEVTVIDCTAPPTSRKQQMALVINLSQRSIHCYERKLVKSIVSIPDLARLECSPFDDRRVTVYATNFDGTNMEAGLKYLCDYIFQDSKTLEDFCKMCCKCTVGLMVTVGKEGRPTWIPDNQTKYCMLDECHKPFSVTNRRHHCRRCGFVVCGTCSSKTAVLPDIASSTPVRVCDKCFRDTVQMRVSKLGTSSILHVRDGSELVRKMPKSMQSCPPPVSSPKIRPQSSQSQLSPESVDDGKSQDYDLYGFPLNEANCHSAPSWDSYLQAQRKRWSTYLSHNTSFKFEKTDSDVKKLVRRGIPPELRGYLWPLLTGSVNRKRRAGEGYYHKLVERSAHETPRAISEQVEKDLERTFPNHQGFEAGECQGILRRVLIAFATHNPAVGYCQSMNFICAVLLLFTEEEDAFWLLVYVIEDLCCVVPQHSPDLPATSEAIVYHQSDLAGVLIDQAVFQELVQRYLPRVASHLEAIELRLDTFTTNWLMCLFATSLPIEVVLHIWDCIFTEGIKIIFRAGLAILKIVEKEILNCESFEDVILFMRSLQEYRFDVERFMRTCFDHMWISNFSWSHIVKSRAKHCKIIMSAISPRKTVKAETRHDIPPADAKNAASHKALNESIVEVTTPPRTSQDQELGISASASTIPAERKGQEGSRLGTGNEERDPGKPSEYLQINKMQIVGEDKTIHFDPKFKTRYKALSWHLLSKAEISSSLPTRRSAPPTPPRRPKRDSPKKNESDRKKKAPPLPRRRKSSIFQQPASPPSRESNSRIPTVQELSQRKQEPSPAEQKASAEQKVLVGVTALQTKSPHSQEKREKPSNKSTHPEKKKIVNAPRSKSPNRKNLSSHGRKKTPTRISPKMLDRLRQFEVNPIDKYFEVSEAKEDIEDDFVKIDSPTSEDRIDAVT